MLNAYYQSVEQYGVLPSRADLWSSLRYILDENPDQFEAGERKRLQIFLRVAYSVDFSDVPLHLVSDRLRRYLEDRMVTDIRQKVQGYTPVDIHAMLQDITDQASRLQAASSSVLNKPFPEDWLATTQVPTLRSTGVPYFDAFLGGEEGEVCGHGCTESLGLIGPYGGGKTITGIMLSVTGAKLSFLDWLSRGRVGPLRIAYHFSWEAPQYELRNRALAYLAQIPQKRVAMAMRQRNLGCLSDDDTLEGYERRKWASSIQSGVRIPGEQKRLGYAISILNHAWRFVDLCNSSENQGLGDELSQDIAIVLRRDQQDIEEEKRGVQVVVADYVGAAVWRHLQAHHLDVSANSRHYIGKWPLDIKNQVAVPFNCPVWSLHQLKAAANALRPGAVPKITDIAEAKSFAENLDFCFLYGTRDAENRLVCVCAKARREALQPPKIIRLDGKFQQMVDESTEYVTQSHNIVPRHAAESIGLDDIPQTQGDIDPMGDM